MPCEGDMAYRAPIAFPNASMLSGMACAGGVDVPAVLGVATLAAKLLRLLLLSAMLAAVGPAGVLLAPSCALLNSAPVARGYERIPLRWPGGRLRSRSARRVRELNVGKKSDEKRREGGRATREVTAGWLECSCE